MSYILTFLAIALIVTLAIIRLRTRYIRRYHASLPFARRHDAGYGGPWWT